MRLDTDRTYEFELTVEQLWQRINQVDRFPVLWPWLHGFDGRALDAGETWRCRVRPPLPYTVVFTIAIDEVVPERSVAATIAGDIDGWAQLAVAPAAGGSTLHLTAALSPRKQSMQALSFVARPLVRYAHDWVLDTGARQFGTGPA